MEDIKPKKKEAKNIWYVILPALIGGFFLLGKAFIDNYNPKPEDPKQKEIKLIKNKIIELKKHKPNITTKNIRNDISVSAKNLSELYENVNLELMKFITNSISNFSDVASGENKLLYLNAPAGSGKTTFFEERWGKPIEINNEKTEIYRINNKVSLRVEKLKKWTANCDKTPDLIKLKSFTPISFLPGTEKEMDSIFSSIINNVGNSHESSIIVFDGIDEISQKAATKFLYIIDNYLENIESNKALSIIVTGRPEGFKDYLVNRPKFFKINFQSFSFKTPTYNNINAIKVRYKNYSNYRKNKTGKDSPNFGLVMKTLNKHSFLFDDFSLLMLSGPIIKNSDTWHSESKVLIQEILFSSIIQRNQKSHDRPPLSDEEYMIALEDVIQKHIIPLSEKGAYFINPNETVLYSDNDKVNIRTLLFRSGFIDFDPLDTEKFYFKPSWIPEHLLNRKIERLNN